MLEHHSQPLISRRHFFVRVARNGGYAGLLVGFSVIAGMIGYHWVGLSWSDAFVNACMLLGGMGPVGELPNTVTAKVFAGLFALYAGLVFLVVAVLLLTPAFHRVLHLFHLERGRQDSR